MSPDKTVTTEQSLSPQVVKGGTVTVICQFFKFFIQFGSLIILARLLTPEEFGVYGIILALIILLEPFKEAGLSTSTIQAKELTDSQINTLFWLNTAIGLILGLLFFLFSPVIGSFYADPRITSIGLAMSGTFLLGGLTAQHRALLRRRMQFGLLSIIEVTALLLSSLLALWLAWQNFGFWSLVLSQIALELIQLIGIGIFAKWRPSVPGRMAEVRSLISFGFFLTVHSFVGYLNHKVQNLLIGWFAGVTQLAFYEKAYQFSSLPLTQLNLPLNNLILTSLSRLQDEPERFRQYFDRYLLISTVLGMPLVGIMFVTADKLVLLFLGSQWSESSLILRALCPAAFLLTMQVSVNWLVISRGLASRQLRWGGVTFPLTLIAGLSGLPWGAFGVAVAFSASRAILFVPTILYASYGSPVRLADVFRSSWRSALAALGALAFAMVVKNILPNFSFLVLEIIIHSIIYGFVYILLWLILPQGWQIWQENLRFLKRMKDEG